MRMIGLAFVMSFVTQKIDYTQPQTQSAAFALFAGTIVAALALLAYIRVRITKRNDGTVLVLKGLRHGVAAHTEKRTTIRAYDLQQWQYCGMKLLLSIAVMYMIFSTTKEFAALMLHSILTTAAIFAEPLMKIYVLGAPIKGDLVRPFGLAGPFAPDGPIQELTSHAELKRLTKVHKSKLIVVDFYASWCPPCRKLAPTLESLATQHPNALFLHSNIDDDTSPARALNITSVPTIQLYKNNQLLDQLSGPSPAALPDLLQAHL